MSTGTESAQELTADPTDDAIVVYDEAGEEEDSREDLVKSVNDYLKGDDAEEEPTEQSGVDDERAHAEEVASEEKPDDLSQAMKDRAQAAGISEELAGRLHQGGLLEESLAAFDRQVIERFSQQSEPHEEPPQPKDQRDSGGDELPDLDADEHGEELSRRESLLRGEIRELKEQVAQLTRTAGDFAQSQERQFEDWFESEVARVGNEDLFGKGPIESLPKDSPQRKNRESLMRGYLGTCAGNGTHPFQRVSDFVDRALPAMFPSIVNEKVKKAQREPIDRLRDVQGRFISPARPSGEMRPARGPELTEEQVDAELVAEVDAYLKRNAG